MCVLVGRLNSKATLGQISCFAACVLLVISWLTLSVGCTHPAAVSESDIPLVRKGLLKIPLGDANVKTYDSASIGTALERKLKNGVWREFSTADGEVVEFDANLSPATLYRDGFSVWSPFLKGKSAGLWNVPGAKGSVSLRAATTCIDDGHKRVAEGPHGGRIVIDCRLLFQMQFKVSADRKSFHLRSISLDTFDTDDQAKVLAYIYNQEYRH